MNTLELADEITHEIMEVIAQKAILPIPLVDIDDLEERIRMIIYDGLTA